MAEEQQVTKEPQQEPQQVITKNPFKVKAGIKLAEYNCRKREEKKARTAEQGASTIEASGGVN